MLLEALAVSLMVQLEPLEMVPALVVMSVGYLVEAASVPVFDSKSLVVVAAELVEWIAVAGGVVAVVEHVVVPVRH